jgi:hypothetical protein
MASPLVVVFATAFKTASPKILALLIVGSFFSACQQAGPRKTSIRCAVHRAPLYEDTFYEAPVSPPEKAQAELIKFQACHRVDQEFPHRVPWFARYNPIGIYTEKVKVTYCPKCNAQYWSGVAQLAEPLYLQAQREELKKR